MELIITLSKDRAASAEVRTTKENERSQTLLTH